MSERTPSLKAMITCDSIITEQGTGKKSLIGIFEKIHAQKFPCVHASLGIYVNFTDAFGAYTFKLELFDMEQEKILSTAEIKDINIPNRPGTSELAFDLRGVGFEHPGRYEFRISANGKVFGIKSFSVEQVKMQGAQQHPGETIN